MSPKNKILCKIVWVEEHPDSLTARKLKLANRRMKKLEVNASWNGLTNHFTLTNAQCSTNFKSPEPSKMAISYLVN